MLIVVANDANINTVYDISYVIKNYLVVWVCLLQA